MKRSLKVISVFLSLVLAVSGFTVFTSAAKPENDKAVFARTMEKKYSSDLKAGRIKKASTEEIEDLRIKYTFASADEKSQIAAEMEKYGTYVYKPFDSTNNTVSILSCGSEDVTLEVPTIFYEAAPNVWVISFGGHWHNYDWTTGAPLLDGNVGGPDAFGVGFTSTSGSYISYVVGSYARIWDQNDDHYISTNNRSDGDGSKGFGFRLQDEVIRVFDYMGYYWYGSCTYATGFSSYDGIATAYYIHTYKEAFINSITFGIEGENAGISFSITNQAQSFPAYSNDTPF